MTRFYLFFFISIFLSTHAHAACVQPNGDHGDMLYNRDHTVMQYCNGMKWISMDASRAGGGADNLGDHTATEDLNMATHKIINAAIPTASADVTNKAYVDAAVASAAGSASKTAKACTPVVTNSATCTCPAGTSAAFSKTGTGSYGNNNPFISDIAGTKWALRGYSYYNGASWTYYLYLTILEFGHNESNGLPLVGLGASYPSGSPPSNWCAKLCCEVLPE
ncbi:MAG: hypothetical protein DI626_08565 [Micavibrio aeruginosavorus]|uniref:Uncharacterized protein n=1 Tax=Micavibrio aeruginosavorus TaxID=349221 RepID=A0A2W4ZP44_9BACT|nr:MAG: hypothetical protein DI626_08565 [Micavibrio aeruginosavorus]